MIPFACREKVQYRTQHAALREAVRLSGLFGKVHHAYRCRYCHRWHLMTRRAGDRPSEGLRHLVKVAERAAARPHND